MRQHHRPDHRGCRTIADIFQTLTDAGPDVTGRILFEITETTALASPTIAKAFSLGMRALGCRVALDDFGTGYGTFTELRHLDLDELKIDQSFVRDMLSNPDDNGIVNTIAFVAREYGLTTVAEGSKPKRRWRSLPSWGLTTRRGICSASRPRSSFRGASGKGSSGKGVSGKGVSGRGSVSR